MTTPSVVAGAGLVLAAASPGRPADHRFDAGCRGEDEGGQEAADLVGYDGKILRKSVDHIKKINEKHNQDVEKLNGSGPEQ